ncbi:hypothetical protein KC878_02905 [Candidatus Saccharibacteria bacterium]|nr:hypothetical protein [Candidatus Saccharibacteria bacterium]MCB9821317.1 hypothetical protein [Candidatus Nomurabacteria bacterium]
MKRAFSFRKGFSNFLHELSRALLPLIVFGWVLSGLTAVAYASIFIYKWRILAVKSRFWAANIRANMTDILIGLSMAKFMSISSLKYQLAWLGFYLAWVLYIKKLSNRGGIMLQGLTAYAISLSALLWSFSTMEFGVMLAGVWLIAYFCSRHILGAFKEDHAPVLAHVWALTATEMAWILWHWQAWYWFVNQLVLVTSIALIGLSLAYYMSRKESPNSAAIKQTLITSGLMMLVVIVLHNWRDTSF